MKSLKLANKIYKTKLDKDRVTSVKYFSIGNFLFITYFWCDFMQNLFLKHFLWVFINSLLFFFTSKLPYCFHLLLYSASKNFRCVCTLKVVHFFCSMLFLGLL